MIIAVPGDAEETLLSIALLTVLAPDPSISGHPIYRVTRILLCLFSLEMHKTAPYGAVLRVKLNDEER